LIGAYFDSSVYVRIILNEENLLREWDTIDLGVSSTLMRVECYRTIERVWRNRDLNDSHYEAARSKADEMLRHVHLAAIDDDVIALAAKPFPRFVNSLDAIHLATAITYRRMQPKDERPILFATHDQQLAKAAAAMHFEVIGASV
jgi:predicted nucleic acid-binding protein